MNGWVEQYGDGSFQYLCAATERAAGLKPRELWSEFNNVFDYLPLAAVSARPQHALLFLTLAVPAAHHPSHITSLHISLHFTHHLSHFYLQVIQGSIFAVHGGLPRRCTWDEGDSGAAALVDASTAPVASSAPSESALPTHAASAPARAPIQVLLDTLPRPWSGENPNDASNKACTAGYDMLWADPVQVNPQPSSLNHKPQSPNPKPQTLNPQPPTKTCAGLGGPPVRRAHPQRRVYCRWQPRRNIRPLRHKLRPLRVRALLLFRRGCLRALARAPPSCLPQVEGMQAAHFWLRERGAGPLPGAQRLLRNT